MIIALEQERFFFFFSSLEGKKNEKKRSRPTSFPLSPIPFHPSTPPPPPFPLSPSSSPPPFSFLLCPTSQLYTLAVATSIVYFPRRTPLVPYPPSKRKKETKDKSRNFVINGTYRNLLPQKINIIFTIRQTLLCRFKFGNEQGFGFREGVGEHDVCLLHCEKG